MALPLLWRIEHALPSVKAQVPNQPGQNYLDLLTSLQTQSENKINATSTVEEENEIH